MRGKVLKDGVGVFITVNCRSKFLINADVCVFIARTLACRCEWKHTQEHRATA